MNLSLRRQHARLLPLLALCAGVAFVLALGTRKAPAIQENLPQLNSNRAQAKRFAARAEAQGKQLQTGWIQGLQAEAFLDQDGTPVLGLRLDEGMLAPDLLALIARSGVDLGASLSDARLLGGLSSSETRYFPLRDGERGAIFWLYSLGHGKPLGQASLADLLDAKTGVGP